MQHIALPLLSDCMVSSKLGVVYSRCAFIPQNVVYPVGCVDSVSSDGSLDKYLMNDLFLYIHFLRNPLIMDILYFLWILPAVMGVEGKSGGNLLNMLMCLELS